MEELGLLDKLKMHRDEEGRTPALCVLGRREMPWAAAEAAAAVDARQVRLERNLDTLLGEGSTLAELRLHLTTPPKSDGGDGHRGGGRGADSCENLTGLMHAARGGRETFALACEKILGGDQAPGPLPLLVVLGLVDSRAELFQGRCERLLAQAALGGDCEVLETIVSSIVHLEQGDGRSSAFGGEHRSDALARCELLLL